MRDFKEPYYTGPECVCCKQLVQDILKRERERLIQKLEEADSACSDWAIAIIEEKTNE
jgi:hypothetical protein